MKQLSFFSISLCIMINCNAQMNPTVNKDTLWTYAFGIEAVQESTLDSNSVLYYPKLEKRFLSGDKIDNITAGVLVIGYTKWYRDESILDYKKTIDSIAEYSSKQQYELSCEICKRILKTYPLDLTALFYLVLNYSELGNSALKESYLSKMKVLIDGILQYGNGTIDRPYLQLNPNDDEIITTIFGGSKIENAKLIDYEVICENTRFKSKKVVQINKVGFTDETGKVGALYFCVNYVANK